MTVFLVGAGPGDPGLLTVRGRDLLGRADVVVHDRLVPAAILDLVGTSAERLAVGKSPREATMTQADINQLLVDRGRTHATVVRLKGGDPFVFGRGGEELEALRDAGIAFEVVPGVSSALAVPAYAGIPVTLRQTALSVTIVTGHEDPDGTTEVDWGAVARLGGTIVILMGAARAGAIAARLMAGGLPPSTPVAAIRWGTLASQEVLRADLATIGDHPLAAPSTIVVGEVAGLNLSWFGPSSA